MSVAWGTSHLGKEYSSQTLHDFDCYALDFNLFVCLWLILIIFRKQNNQLIGIIKMNSLDCCLAINIGNDNVTFIRNVLLSNENIVPVFYSCINH